MPTRAIAALAGALVLLVCLAFWFGASSGSSQKAPKAPQVAESALVLAPTSAPKQQPPHNELEARPPSGRTRTALDSLARDELLKSLDTLQSRRLAVNARVASVSAAPIAALPLNISNKTGSTSDWEATQIQTLRELLGECYELAVLEEPGLAGNFGLRFSLAAEPEVGGLVDNVVVMEDYSSIEQVTMRECMLESIYALELEPPPEGVRVDREITLRFDDD